MNITIDIMVNDGRTFYRTLSYPHQSLFRVSLNDMFRWLYERVPSIFSRDDAVLFINVPGDKEYRCRIVTDSNFKTNSYEQI